MNTTQKFRRPNNFSVQGTVPQPRVFKSRKTLQRPRYKKFRKSVYVARRSIYVRRQMRVRRSSRTRALFYRQTLISSLSRVYHPAIFAGLYKRTRSALALLSTRAIVQKFDYVTSRYLQPTITRAQVLDSVSQITARGADENALSQMSVSRTYATAGHHAHHHTQPAFQRSLLRTVRLVKQRRYRYFAKRIKKMYIDTRRARLTKKTKVHVRKATFLVIRKASRGRYVGLFGKQRRHIERRDRVQVKRTLYNLQRKRQLAARLVISALYRKPRRFNSAASQKTPNMSSSLLLEKTDVVQAPRRVFGVKGDTTATLSLYSYISKSKQVKTAAVFAAATICSRKGVGATNATMSLRTTPNYSPSHPARRLSPTTYLNQDKIFSTQQSTLLYKLHSTYRKRVKLRLPNTYVSRTRRRRAGRGLLLNRQVLHTVTSTSALKSGLLPPAEAVSFVQSSLSTAHKAQHLFAGRRLSDARPRF